MDGRTNGGAYGLVDLLCSPKAHTRVRGARAVGLLCSPNAHARSIVFAESRCSSKRAVGDQSALPRRENERAWKDHWNGPSNIASRHRLGDHNDRTMHPLQVAETPPSTSVEGKTRRPISLAPKNFPLRPKHLIPLHNSYIASSPVKTL